MITVFIYYNRKQIHPIVSLFTTCSENLDMRRMSKMD